MPDAHLHSRGTRPSPSPATGGGTTSTGSRHKASGSLRPVRTRALGETEQSLTYRDRLTSQRQLFGQATCRTRHHQAQDNAPHSFLTQKEAMTGLFI